MLPEVRDELQIDNTTFGAILGAWPLVYIFAAIPAGVFLDFVGGRVSLFLAAVLIGTSAALRGWATTPEVMFFAVAVFGLGGPLISVGAPKLIAGLFEGKSRRLAVGIYLTGPNAGAILTLGLTNDWLIPIMGDWRGVMLAHAGFAIAAGLIWLALASSVSLPRAGQERTPFNMSVMANLMAQREVWIVLALALGGFFINHSLNNWLAAILRDKGMNPSMAGYWASIPTLVGMAAAIVLPRLASTSRRFPLLIGLCLSTSVASLFIIHGDGVLLGGGLVVQGVVRGAMNAIVIVILMELPGVPSERVGLAGGLYFTAGEIGGVLGPFSMGALYDLTDGFSASLYCLALVALFLAALAAWLGNLVARVRR